MSNWKNIKDTDLYDPDAKNKQATIINTPKPTLYCSRCNSNFLENEFNEHLCIRDESITETREVFSEKKPALDERKFRELWIGWPDGENPTVCENYDLGCEKFIEYAAIAEMQEEHKEHVRKQFAELVKRQRELQEENQKLREALENIVNAEFSEVSPKIKELARQSLEGE